MLRGLRVTENIFKETHRRDRYTVTQPMSPLRCSLGCKCFIKSLLFLPLCHWCKRYAKLLESEKHLSNRDLGFWAVYFPALLDGAAAQTTEIYLVSETENIDQKHVLLREDKHASFIPHCQFSLTHLKAPQQGWELWDDSISAPTTDKKIYNLNGIFYKMYEFWSPFLLQPKVGDRWNLISSNVDSREELISAQAFSGVNQWETIPCSTSPADSISVYLAVLFTLWSPHCLHKTIIDLDSNMYAHTSSTFSKKIESCNCTCSIDFKSALEEIAMTVEITGNKEPMQCFSVMTKQGFKGLAILVWELLILI